MHALFPTIRQVGRHVSCIDLRGQHAGAPRSYLALLPTTVKVGATEVSVAVVATGVAGGAHTIGAVTERSATTTGSSTAKVLTGRAATWVVAKGTAYSIEPVQHGGKGVVRTVLVHAPLPRHTHNHT